MYPKILNKNMDPSKVSKITGMLIDLDILELEEIIDILQNEASLKERIKEALEVIDESEDWLIKPLLIKFINIYYLN